MVTITVQSQERAQEVKAQNPYATVVIAPKEPDSILISDPTSPSAKIRVTPAQDSAGNVVFVRTALSEQTEEGISGSVVKTESGDQLTLQEAQKQELIDQRNKERLREITTRIETTTQIERQQQGSFTKEGLPIASTERGEIVLTPEGRKEILGVGIASTERGEIQIMPSGAMFDVSLPKFKDQGLGFDSSKNIAVASTTGGFLVTVPKEQMLWEKENLLYENNPQGIASGVFEILTGKRKTLSSKYLKENIVSSFSKMGSGVLTGAAYSILFPAKLVFDTENTLRDLGLLSLGAGIIREYNFKSSIPYTFVKSPINTVNTLLNKAVNLPSETVKDVKRNSLRLKNIGENAEFSGGLLIGGFYGSKILTKAVTDISNTVKNIFSKVTGHALGEPMKGMADIDLLKKKKRITQVQELIEKEEIPEDVLKGTNIEREDINKALNEITKPIDKSIKVKDPLKQVSGKIEDFWYMKGTTKVKELTELERLQRQFAMTSPNSYLRNILQKKIDLLQPKQIIETVKDTSLSIRSLDVGKLRKIKQITEVLEESQLTKFGGSALTFLPILSQTTKQLNRLDQRLISSRVSIPITKQKQNQIPILLTKEIQITKQLQPLKQIQRTRQAQESIIKQIQRQEIIQPKITTPRVLPRVRSRDNNEDRLKKYYKREIYGSIKIPSLKGLQPSIRTFRPPIISKSRYTPSITSNIFNIRRINIPNIPKISIGFRPIIGRKKRK